MRTEGGTGGTQVILGQQSCQCQRCLGQAEARARIGVGRQGFARIQRLFYAEVDRAQADKGIAYPPGKHLDGRLAIERHGYVYHRPSVFKTVRRSIGPPSGEIEADGTAGPDDLVFLQGVPRENGTAAYSGDDGLAKASECRLSVMRTRFPGRELREEHAHARLGYRIGGVEYEVFTARSY